MQLSCPRCRTIVDIPPGAAQVLCPRCGFTGAAPPQPSPPPQQWGGGAPPPPPPPAPAPSYASAPPAPAAAGWGSPYAAPAPRRPAAPVDLNARTRTAFTPRGILGIALAVAAITGMILNFTLPWLSSGDNTDVEQAFGDSVDRGEVNDLHDATDAPMYNNGLVWWPILVFIFWIIVGAGLFVMDVIPGMSVGLQRAIQAGLLGVGAFFSFLLALTGFRWLGAWITETMGPGDATDMHVVPWLNLVLGTAACAACVLFFLQTMRPFDALPNRSAFGTWGVRIPVLTLMVAAGGLLLFPMLPYAQADTGGDDDLYFGEYQVARQFGEDGTPDNIEDVFTDLNIVRLMVWLTVFVTLATYVFALVERTGKFPMLWGTLCQIYALNVVAIIVGLIFTLLLYIDIPQIEQADVSLSFNYLPILVYGALAAMYILYAINILPGFIRRAQAQAAASRAAQAAQAPQGWGQPPGQPPQWPGPPQ